jgi:hypothetical protein
MQIYAVITSTKLVMKLKLVSLESGSSLSNDAIFVSIRCIVWKIFAFKTTPLKNDTFQPDENELKMWLSMRSISFHVPQAKEQILLYKFPAQASLMVDPARPCVPNDRYSYLMVEFWRALRYTTVVSFST